MRRPGATQRSRSRRTRAGHRSARDPHGWANHACRAGPSRRPSFVVPASDLDAAGTGSNDHSWWMPAIATDDPLAPPGDVPRRRERRHRAGDRAGAVPATGGRCRRPCVTAPSDSRTPRSSVVDGVGDHDVVPDLRRDARRQQAEPVGLCEPRRPAPPSTRPRSPDADPAHHRLAVADASSTSEWWPASATRACLSGNDDGLGGEAQRRVRPAPERRTGRPRLQRAAALVRRDQLGDQRLSAWA